MKNKLISKEYLYPFILLTTLFFAWGLANNMTDTLLAAFKRIMSMSDFQTSWIQMAFYGAYFCLALPAAILIKKTTYKTGIIVGLIMFIVGGLLFYPCSKTMVYGHFLVALYILAGGLSVLETTANPYILLLGDKQTAIRRLNFAQSFNPIGSIAGVLMSQLFILSDLTTASAEQRSMMDAKSLLDIQTNELNAVMGPYVWVSIVLIVILILIAFAKMPKANDGNNLNLGTTIKRLVANKRYVRGVVTQFFYVGAQISIWSFTIRYAMKELSIAEDGAATYYVLSLVMFICARFIFTFLLKYFQAGKLLFFAAVMAVLCCVGTISCEGYLGLGFLVAISFFMSLMFPTIYSLTIVDLGSDSKIAGSGMIMAIVGGAVITSLQGFVSDKTGIVNYSYVIPLLCFIVVMLYACFIIKQSNK